jgi:hypothetical protein
MDQPQKGYYVVSPAGSKNGTSYRATLGRLGRHAPSHKPNCVLFAGIRISGAFK